MWSGFQAKKLNTRGELELKLAVYQDKPENQAELVPGPDPDQKNISIFFSKNQIRHLPCSERKRTAWFLNICPRKGVYQKTYN